jgi:hypothetical protein
MAEAGKHFFLVYRMERNDTTPSQRVTEGNPRAVLS